MFEGHALGFKSDESSSLQVDGVPVATAPVVPSRGGRRSLFSVTIAAPSSRGAHTIVGAARSVAYDIAL